MPLMFQTDGLRHSIPQPLLGRLISLFGWRRWELLPRSEISAILEHVQALGVAPVEMALRSAYESDIG